MKRTAAALLAVVLAFVAGAFVGALADARGIIVWGDQ